MQCAEREQEWFEAACRILSGAQGEANAVTIEELMALAGLPSRRTTEELLEHRLADFPWPLVATSAGLFIPTDPEEINHYQRSLRARAVKIFLRARTVRRKALAYGWRRDGKWFACAPRQMGLWEGEGGPPALPTSGRERAGSGFRGQGSAVQERRAI